MASSSPHRSKRSPSPSSSRRRRDSRERSSSRDRSRRHGNRSKSPSRDSKRNRSRSRSPRHRSSRRHRSKSPRSSESRHKSRRHSRSPTKSHRSSRHRRRDSSTSASSYSSDSEYERKKREHRKHKKDKKHKKSKKKKSKLSVGDQWGKYGIIHESDIFTKEPEFQAWLIEVKEANVETLNNNKRKEMFIDFMEDYNTATMPHEKFYNLEKWEKRQDSIRMGISLPMTSDSFNFREDEEKIKAQHKMSRQAAASRQPSVKLSQEQIEELTRINRERVEADRMRKMGLKPKESMGVRYEYEEI